LTHIDGIVVAVAFIRAFTVKDAGSNIRRKPARLDAHQYSDTRPSPYLICRGKAVDDDPPERLYRQCSKHR
jgi:hypothetical protein